MFKYVLIVAVAYFFFRWQEKSRLQKADEDPRLRYDKSKEKKSAVSDDEGDYIDYEEVD